MEEYIRKEGKTLRLGYTTGSCAAAAAKAAAFMLLSGHRKEQIHLRTPKGLELLLDVKEIRMEPHQVSCAIEKDSGDDPDITNGTLIYASVSDFDQPGIVIDGGAGVGRVTKRGLEQPVGAAAINSIPRQMIRENLEEVCRMMDYHGGLSVVVSVPDGEMLAKKTYNSRLGIIGGISILGTSGIVEPMSEQALVDTIRVELQQRKAQGDEYVLLTPGNYGSDYIRTTLGLNPQRAVITSNFIGDTLDICRELDFRGALLVGHIGKLIKLAGGMMNTHSKFGDCRMELMAAYAGAEGMHADRISELLQCVACDDGIRILDEAGIRTQVLARLTERISFMLKHKTSDDLEIGAIVFSKEYGTLCQTPKSEQLLRIISDSDRQELEV